MTRSLWIFLLSALAVGFSASSARSAPIVEQVTAGNAATDLFGGSDADGGIDDWYMTNGVVQLIIDDVGPQADLVPLVGAQAPDKVSEFAFTGCSIIDLGRAGKNNDQLSQLFTVGGLSTSNFITYDTLTTSSTPTSATVTCTGHLLGFDGVSSPTPVPPANLEVTSTFTLEGSNPYVTVNTSVTNTHPTNSAVGLGGFLDVSIWTLRAQVPFSPIPNRGFRHRTLNLANPSAALEFVNYSAAPGVLGPADGIVDTVTGLPTDECSYGFLGEEVSLDPDGAGPDPADVGDVSLMFGISSNFLTAFGNFPTGDLDPGEVLTYKRRFYVGNKNDVAAVANDMITELSNRTGSPTGTISGNIDAFGEPNVKASIIATSVGAPPGSVFMANAPITQARTDATGAFSGVVLPVGTYNLQIQSPLRNTVTVNGVVVTAGNNTVVATPMLSKTGSLEVAVTEKVPGAKPRAIPARLTFIGVKGTPNPRFGKDFDAISFLPGNETDLMPETFGGGAAQRNWVYLDDGADTVQLPAGYYEVYISHGPEYTLRRKKIRVKDGSEKKLRARIRRVVDTSGFISADFHIHSGRSQDTQAGIRDRVISFAGEQVEVMVSTDHDFHLDYAPLISSLNLGNEVTSIVGNEVTGSVPNPPAFPDSYGHINAWPLPVIPNARRDGAIEEEFVAPNWLYKRLRDQGAEVIQYNHVRAGVSGVTSIGFFNNFGYDPDLPISASPNDLLLDDDVLGPGISGVSNPTGLRNIDFDATEIMNGTSIPDYIAVRRDWLSLLNQTDFSTVPFIKGTGTSDSHRVTIETAGYARSYVGGAGDDPATLNVTTFNNEVLAGNLIGTTGPFVRFSMSEDGGASAGLGEVLVPNVPGPSADLTLHIEVEAAPWVAVQQVRVISNGFNTLTFDESTTPAVGKGGKRPWTQSPKAVKRFEADIPITVNQDTYFIVEAGTALSPLPTVDPFIDSILPGMIPIAFTNPIFVDTAGDGFDPPGLPVMAKAKVPASEVPMFARIERRDQSWFASTGTWLRDTIASLGSTRTAVAGEEQKEALTGRDLAAKVKKERNEITPEYFPLDRFSIPKSAIDEALNSLPEDQRAKARAQSNVGNK